MSDKSSVDSNYEHFLYTFEGKDGNHYGFRYGEPRDARQLTEIFKDVYDWNYLYPKVYDEILLAKDISQEEMRIVSDKTVFHDILTQLEKEMLTAAKELKFEEAAELRDRIKKLKKLHLKIG